jgi:soluble lytic murein transglycosylase
VSERKFIPAAARALWAPVLLALLLPLGARAASQVWSYTDESGSVSFTDTPSHAGYERVTTRERRPARHHRVVSLRTDPDAWDRAIARAGRAHQVKPGLVKAVIHAESNFDARAVSRAGARGLMQLMPSTAQMLGVDDPFDPWQNINGGTRYLHYLMGRFGGDLRLSLAAYNAGESVVRRHGGVPPYAETRRYVARVLRLYRRYDGDFR